MVVDILEQEGDILMLGILAYILLEEDNLELDILKVVDNLQKDIWGVGYMVLDILVEDSLGILAEDNLDILTVHSLVRDTLVEGN